MSPYWAALVLAGPAALLFAVWLAAKYIHRRRSDARLREALKRAGWWL